jgi:hypothetical protein
MSIPVWLKPALWGAACGAILLAFVGFSQLGWQTTSGAKQLAQETADTAVVAALVPFCVAKAQRDGDMATLTKLRAEQSSYSRSNMVRQAGWATLGRASTPDGPLAVACSTELYAMK